MTGASGTWNAFGGKPESDIGEGVRRMRRSNWGFIVPHWIRAKRRSDLSAFVIAECSCTPVVLSRGLDPPGST